MKTEQLNNTQSTISSHVDYIGASASSLCLIHCMLTPVLFAVQSASINCADYSPAWWKSIDYVFLAISFLAIYISAKSSTSAFVSGGLYIWWFILVFIIANSTLQWLLIPHASIYIPAIAITALHLYNLKYCRCQDMDAV